MSNTCICGRAFTWVRNSLVHQWVRLFKSDGRSLMWALLLCFCLLKSRNHHEQWSHTRRSSLRTDNSSRNPVYEREVYKYSTGEFMFKMWPLRGDAILCFFKSVQIFCNTDESSKINLEKQETWTTSRHVSFSWVNDHSTGIIMQTCSTKLCYNLLLSSSDCFI